jgi:hypothetical protein
MILTKPKQDYLIALVTAWIIAISLTRMQAQPIFLGLLLVPLGFLLLQILHRPIYLFWFIVPLLWIHHSSTVTTAAILFFSFLLELDGNAELRRKQSTHKLTLLCIISTLGITLFHEFSMDAFGQWVWDFGIIILYLQLLRVTLSFEQIKKIVGWILFCAAIPALTAVIEGLLHPGMRATGINDINPTGVAFNLSVFTPLALGAIAGSRHKWLPITAATLCFAAVYFTGSRAPTAFVLIACLPFLLEYRLSLLAGGSALMAGMLFSGGGIVSRLENLEQGTSSLDASSVMRLVSWGVALHAILEAPFIGVGLGHFRAIMQTLVPFRDFILAHPHNAVLNKAVQIGLPLTLLFFTVIVLILVNNGKIYLRCQKFLSNSDRLLFMGLMLAPLPLFACGITDAIFNGYAQPFVFWILLALQTLVARAAVDQRDATRGHGDESISQDSLQQY